MTENELAGRAGISRATLQKIERGDLKCEIGLVFEVATLVGVKLFEAEDSSAVALHLGRINDKLALLPQSVRTSVKVDDDF
jgi:DNA-binding XRE family transcriptional regulator